MVLFLVVWRSKPAFWVWLTRSVVSALALRFFPIKLETRKITTVYAEQRAYRFEIREHLQPDLACAGDGEITGRVAPKEARCGP